MSTYQDHRYDVTVECDECHDMYDCEIQLYSSREVALVKALVKQLITRCHNCGAGREALAITVSNEYFTAKEIKQLRKKEKKWVYLYRRRKDSQDIL